MTALGHIFNGAPADFALGPSTSYGLHIVANGYPFEAGDEVLLFSDDFPATYLPWTGLAGIELRVEPRAVLHEPDRLAAAIGPRTRLACFAWVSSFTGDVIPLEAAAPVLRGLGVTVVLNASQGAGALPLDLDGAGLDAVASCGWKWLCGPYGTGFLWTSPALRQRLQPNHRYWRALGVRLDDAGAAGLPHPLPDTWPLDVFGTAAFTTIDPWVESLELLGAIGAARIREHSRSLLDRLRRGLAGFHEIVSPEAAPVVVVDPGGEAEAARLGTGLAEARVHVAVRGGRIRIAPHLYNTEADADAAVEVLRRR